MSTKRSHRSDLQGLRAIAVLAVVSYHFGLAGTPGGFVGVDVFFVLSGFFISQLLLREINDRGSIDIFGFWAGRVKRLLPNSLLAIVVVLAATTLLLPSYRLPNISEDASAASLFYANFHFAARAVDYFHINDPKSPLLHYWSLAVEEQFYVILPAVFLLAARVRTGKLKIRFVLFIMTVVCLMSFFASLHAIQLNQPAAFFKTHYRAWQLSIGCILGILFLERLRIPSSVRAWLAAFGALAVAGSILFLSDEARYPGYLALFPTLGAVALIAGLDAPGARVLASALSTPPLVRIGDLSYSLYLWHWPVVVFGFALLPEPNSFELASMIAVSFVLALLAYRCVERPLHRMSLSRSNTGAVVAAGCGGIALVFVASHSSARWAVEPDSAITKQILAATGDLGTNYKNGCHLDYDDTVQPTCRFGRVGVPRVTLFGDSHAAHWFSPLLKAAEDAGWQLEVRTKTSCPPIKITIRHPKKRSVYRECELWRADRVNELLVHPPDLLILGYSSHYEGWIYDASTDDAADRSSERRYWQTGFNEMISLLTDAGISVVEIRDTPLMFASFKDCLSAGDWSSCGRPRFDALRGLVGSSHVSPLLRRLDLTDLLCSSRTCSPADNGEIWYRDTDHLTATFAATLHQHFFQLLVSR